MPARRPMTKPVQTQMADSGLRYTAKAGGSPFGSGLPTMSCFRCGKHRPAAQLQSQRLLGRVQRVCKPSCAEADPA